MSDVDAVSSVTSSSAADAAPSTSPGGTAGEFNASTQISSLADLKEKAPTLYKAMMEGIGTNIVNEMKDHQDRLKEMQREAQRQAEGG